MGTFESAGRHGEAPGREMVDGSDTPTPPRLAARRGSCRVEDRVLLSLQDIEMGFAGAAPCHSF